jgi:hypothetical protein
MPQLVESQPRNLASTLRDQLDQAERLIVQVDGDTVATLLTLLDRIDQTFDDLIASGMDVRPEQSRWESLLNRVNSRPEPIVRAAAVAGGLPKLRAEHAVGDSFWWHLDAELTRRRAHTLRRTVITLVALAVIVVGAFWAINTFFPPDPEAVVMVETTNVLGALVADQRWEEALQVVQNARSQYPNNAELAVWEGVFYERLDQPDKAQAALDDAQQLLAAQPVQYWVYLGNDRMMVGDLDGAEAAANEGLALAPDEPQLVFLLGGIAEARGDIPTAIKYFEQTFALAQDTQPQLAVIARVRMGQLLQSSAVFQSPVATPAP